MSWNRKHFVRYFFCFTGLWMAGMLILSCAMGSRVYFTGSNDIAQEFETGTLLPDHQYYYGGPKAKPNAIVAIHKDYVLDSPHWHLLTHFSAADLKSLAQTTIFVGGIEYKTSPNGARIIVPGGEQAGVWYSAFEYPIIRMMGEKRLYIADPIPCLPSDTQVKMRDE